jgi:hypothetical protein
MKNPGALANLHDAAAPYQFLDLIRRLVQRFGIEVHRRHSRAGLHQRQRHGTAETDATPSPRHECDFAF